MTDPRTLADRVGLIADDNCRCPMCRDLRVAAVLLRHHANLLDAIGDLSGGWTVREGEMILDRIADAVDGPT